MSETNKEHMDGAAEDTPEPEKLTMDEWSKTCAFAVLPGKDGLPVIVSNPGAVPYHLMYGALSQELALMQAMLTTQVTMDTMQELRRQAEVQRQLAMPSGSPARGMKRR